MNRIGGIFEPALKKGSTSVALGLFDGLHIGHRAVLNIALAIAAEKKLEPAVFSFDLDEGFPAGKRDMTRILSKEAAGALYERMGIKHLICPAFESLRAFSPEEFANLLQDWMGAAAVVCGYDFRFGKNAVGTAEHLVQLGERRGFEVRIVPPVCLGEEPVSSRVIRRLIQEGEMERAGRMLGRPFFIDFEVIAGRKIGRTLGWPTINQPFPEAFTTPRFGVYATRTRIGEHSFSSVTNVGVKPTVGSDRILAETYIQGFSGDLYHRRVEVDFLSFLRPEQKFESLEALRQCIFNDAAIAAGIAAEYIDI